MTNKGQLIIMSGFSGSGKGTITQALLDNYHDEYALSISATTRTPRNGEQEGVHYFFLTKEAFEQMISEGAFLEYAQYVGNYYGTPKKYVEDQLALGKNVILEIEIQGALQVKKMMPQALLLFITPPSAKELKARLQGRGTETEEVIASRMARAIQEAEGCEVYDYLVVNDQLEDTVNRIHQIIQSEKCKMNLNIDLIDQIRQELNEMKGE